MVLSTKNCKGVLNFCLRRRKRAMCQRLRPVILATWEAEIRRITFRG
jgi:hypothetical protein